MKRPKCSGAGYIYNNLVGYAEDCSVCHGKGEVQTNEEWLRQCTTEQLAEFLAGIINTNHCGYLLSCNECGLNDRCREDEYPSSKEAWGEWLKQPHTESVTNCNE